MTPQQHNPELVQLLATFQEQLVTLLERLDHFETRLQLLVPQRPLKEWYSPTELAELLGKKAFTVREWCRLGRIRARKRPCGRGTSQEWFISHDEVERFRNQGLLP